MEKITILNWFVNVLIFVGAALLAISPKYAEKSSVPFVLMSIGQICALYCCYTLNNWPYFALGIGFQGLNFYGIFIRARKSK